MKHRDGQGSGRVSSVGGAVGVAFLFGTGFVWPIAGAKGRRRAVQLSDGADRQRTMEARRMF